MDIRFQAGGPAAWKADIALLFVCREDAPADSQPELAQAAPWFTIAHAVQLVPVRKEVIDFRPSPFGRHTFYGVDIKQ